MTKTHCTGYNTEGNIQTYIVNRKQFVKGCAKIHWKENGVVRFSQYDDRILPKRAIRLVRDPFDNVVSNYNHWVQNQMKKDDKLKDYNSDEERFQAYCVRHNNSFKQKMKDENIEIFKDEEMKEMLKEVPCHQHFFRYVQVSVKGINDDIVYHTILESNEIFCPHISHHSLHNSGTIMLIILQTTWTYFSFIMTTTKQNSMKQ